MTVAVPDCEESAWLVAVTVTVCCVAIDPGAVYNPFTTVPTAGDTDQVTLVFALPVTTAVNCCDCPVCKVAEPGVMVTEILWPPRW